MKQPTHNDIAQLLERFMDGQTTLQEEALLAQYFRTADVPEGWRDYQQIFAWFDEGMPEAQPSAPQRRKPWLLWFSAAAAVALLLLILQPWRQLSTTSQNKPSAELLTAQTDTTTATTQPADSLQTPTQLKTKPQPKTKRPRYSLPRPATYYAEVKPIPAKPTYTDDPAGDSQLLTQQTGDARQDADHGFPSLQQREDNIGRAIQTLYEADQLEATLAMEGLLEETDLADDELW